MSSGMVASYMLASQKSAYHEKCIPRQNAATQAQAHTDTQHRESEYRGCDNVTQDKIWKQSVAAERRCLQNWSDNWGFLTEFDAKGNPAEKEELPEKVSVFSENVPNTNSGNYGSRLKTEPGQMMQTMEFQFYSERRRRKLGDDMVCY